MSKAIVGYFGQMSFRYWVGLLGMCGGAYMAGGWWASTAILGAVIVIDEEAKSRNQ